MNPTRLPEVKPLNGVLRASQKLILTAGAVLTIFGIVALFAEMWRTFTGLNDIRPKYLGVAFLITSFGLALMQTLNPIKVIQLGIQMRRSQLPGGQRFYDPPPETAPPQMPREQWPKPPPRTSRQKAADKESKAADKAAIEERDTDA